MFLQKLTKHDHDGVKRILPRFLRSLDELAPLIDADVGETPLAKVASSFVDIWPKSNLPNPKGFGGVFVRVWAVGQPTTLIYGLYLGSKTSKAESEINRGVSYARSRLANLLQPLEVAGGPGFKYHPWKGNDLGWIGGIDPRSARAIPRQFDLFLTYKRVALDATTVRNVIEDIRMLVQAAVSANQALTPLSTFAKELVLRFFVPEGVLMPEEPPAVPQIEIDWEQVAEATAADAGLVGLNDQFRQVVNAVKSGKQVVLYGPPGTGKTELALAVCNQLGIPRDLVTATSDWTTFDTIGGYLPDPSLAGEGNSEPLNFFPAVVSQALQRGRWLIIDELNRADIDKAFGELFTLLTGRSVRLPFKRRDGAEFLPVVLGTPDPGDGEVYAIPVPDNWRMIGTMNTFDKSSLYQLSFAFMRRFAFVYVPVPSTVEYRNLIDSKSIELGDPAENAVFRTHCVEYISQIFAPNDGEHLDRLGLIVGPAIALDMIRYLVECRPGGQAPEGFDSLQAYARARVLEAVEMYLYPQFEGRDKAHEDIVAILRDIFELDDVNASRTGSILSSWTGYEEP